MNNDEIIRAYMRELQKKSTASRWHTQAPEKRREAMRSLRAIRTAKQMEARHGRQSEG